MPISIPPVDGFVAGWWDAEADRSLLVGTHRHGFERYNMMRLDPGLCFLARCGPPDNAAVQVIGHTDIRGNQGNLNSVKGICTLFLHVYIY